MESVLLWPDAVVVCVADTAQARTCAIRTLVHVALRWGDEGALLHSSWLTCSPHLRLALGQATALRLVPG